MNRSMFSRLLKVNPPQTQVQAMPNDTLRLACDAIRRSVSSVHRGPAIEPPAAAMVDLLFRREYPGGQPIEIPMGTRVSTSEASGTAEVFRTLRAARINPGQNEVCVLGCHAELVDGELLGVTTDLDQIWVLARPPIVAATSADLELRVGVSCDSGEVRGADRVVTFEGRPFLLWSELGPVGAAPRGTRRFISDRLSGEIVPLLQLDLFTGGREAFLSPAARQVRAWYWRGGGSAGNVAAGTLSVLRDSLRGVIVTNPAAARGGRDAGPARS